MHSTKLVKTAWNECHDIGWLSSCNTFPKKCTEVVNLVLALKDIQYTCMQGVEKMSPLGVEHLVSKSVFALKSKVSVSSQFRTKRSYKHH